MGTRENAVETYLNDQVVKLGGITRKWVCPSRDGIPDRIVVVRGRIVFVEVKPSDGRLSTCQEREHIRLGAAGASVKTVYGVDGVDNFIKDLSNTLNRCYGHECGPG